MRERHAAEAHADAFEQRAARQAGDRLFTDAAGAVRVKVLIATG